MLRVEIHLCCVAGCAEPPAFLHGADETPVCEKHYEQHKHLTYSEALKAYARGLPLDN